LVSRFGRVVANSGNGLDTATLAKTIRPNRECLELCSGRFFVLDHGPIVKPELRPFPRPKDFDNIRLSEVANSTSGYGHQGRVWRVGGMIEQERALAHCELSLPPNEERGVAIATACRPFARSLSVGGIDRFRDSRCRTCPRPGSSTHTLFSVLLDVFLQFGSAKTSSFGLLDTPAAGAGGALFPP
jgi:hypothetical protein